MKTRLEREKETLTAMIALYCTQKHHKSELCGECQKLLDYAQNRLKNCRFGETKPTCNKCPIHCYQPEMRQAIRTVMRYSGPRMLLRHPVMAIRHLAQSLARNPHIK